MPPDVPEIVSDEPDTFAWHVWHDRHPALFGRLRAAHPYPPRALAALDALLDETVSGAMRPPPDRTTGDTTGGTTGDPTGGTTGDTAHGADGADSAAWREWGAGYFGRSWLSVPFLWAESYFYRRLLDAVGYFAPGPWRGVDPFQFLKTAELEAPELADDLRALDAVARLPVPERTAALLRAALWGNRVDLGFRMGVVSGPEHPGAGANLVADDTAATVAVLADRPGTVCVVADNAGPDLLSDLALIDHLLDALHADRVVLHLKPHPYYVSDAVTTDLVQALGRLRRAGGTAGAVAERLRSAAATGRFDINTHWFHCAPFGYHRMPDDLARHFAAAALVIFKGDLNYRRLVGDRRWPPDTAFAATTAYFPAPVAALRILKSEAVVGVDPPPDAPPDWRTNGRFGLLQARPRRLSTPPESR